MSKWLRGSFNSSMSKIYNDKIDEVAAYNAFVQHWHQISQIFITTEENKKVTCDEVTAVTNHFGKMINLLLVDLNHVSEFKLKETRDHNIFSANKDPSSFNIENLGFLKFLGEIPPTPMYDYFMGERILESISQWSFSTGEFVHTMQLELLKVYEMILSHSNPEVLVFKPITQPLLTLLNSCSGCIPVEVEKRLLVLLNHLWVAILHNTQLLDYFYLPKESNPAKRFIIFNLLLPFTHREGSLGQQARDTLLLCMTLCHSNDIIAEYVAHTSNFCPFLAAGLSGLYSMLPRTLHCGDALSYCLCPIEVANSSSLQMFMNYLEFCNAVAQTAHPIVRKQLINFLYQGFLLTVVGPALSQNVADELIAAIVYIDFFLQSVTEEGLRKAFLTLLFLPHDFCEIPVISMLISCLHSLNLQLSLVVLNLFETLISFHCEDVMVSLVFQYLSPCNHIMLSQITKLIQPTLLSSEQFFKLLPIVCQENYLEYSHAIPSSVQQNHLDDNLLEDKTYSSSTFVNYLNDAKYQVAKSTRACSSWAWKYNGQSPSPHESALLLRSNRVESFGNPASLTTNSEYISLPCNSFKVPFENRRRATSLPNFSSLDFIYNEESFTKEKNFNDTETFKYTNKNHQCKNSKLNRVTSNWFVPCEDMFNNCMMFVYNEAVEPSHDSVDESSGYESFTCRGSQEGSSHGVIGECKKISKASVNNCAQEEPIYLTFPLKTADEEFIQFLERCTSPSISTDPEDFMVIEEAYSFLESNNLFFECQDTKMVHQSIKEKFCSKQLSSSTSSIDGLKGDLKDIATSLQTQSKPTLGPFLEALLQLVENLLTLNTDVVILVMSCVSKLATLPCSLLTSILLHPSIVLQPSVRSLYQVLGQLKQKIDCVLMPDDITLLKEARTKLMHCLSLESETKSNNSFNSSFSRGPKRKSFSQTVSAFLKRATISERNFGREISLQNLPDGSGYRYFNTAVANNQQLSSFASASVEKQQAAICSVLLKDWLLELTAITYEHTVNYPELHYASLSHKMRAH